MASTQDAVSNWCVSNNFSKSFWATNDNAFNLLLKDVTPPPNVRFDDIVQKSECFPIEFPVDTVKCKELQKHVKKDSLEKYINSVYPIIHEKVLQFCAWFLLYKSGSNGSRIEQELYKNMDLLSFIDRLLTKRAVVFIGPRDSYLLLSGVKSARGWEAIGTEQENLPLTLENCLSYDEIKISAFLSVASYTHFLNIGDRTNEGVYFEDRSNIENEGVIVGLIGPRFKKQNVMDYQDIVHDNIQTVSKNMVVDFYEESYVQYQDIKNNSEASNRFTEYNPGKFFDDVIYSKRIAISFDTFLHEANQRAKDAGKMAYVHMVGIGLGVWKISPHQNKIFMDTCANRLGQLGKYLNHISDICFAYLRVTECGSYNNGDIVPIENHPNGGIKVHIFDREPHEKLKRLDEGKLLVVSYAWDGNALPGNEFWIGSLSGSGDPAAASSTQVAELHNAHINPKVCGDNLRVVTPGGVLTFEDYKNKVITDINQAKTD